MRYTKEMQSNVCADVKYGIAPQECAKKYNIPVSLVLKWCDIKVSEQRAKEIALRKYQEEISTTEASLMGKLSDYISPNISDDNYIALDEKISKSLYSLAAKIVIKERNLNPESDAAKSNYKIVNEISERWNNNQSLKRYGRIWDEVRSHLTN